MPALHAFALGQLLLLLLLLWPQARQQSSARCFFALLAVLTVEVLRLSWAWPEPWQWLLSAPRAAIPTLFWLFCLATFAERLPSPRVIAGALLAVVVLPWLSRGMADVSGVGQSLAQGLGLFGQTLEFGLLAHALWVMAREWQHDLVEARRRWRWFLLGSSAVWIVAVVLAEQLLPGGVQLAQTLNQWLLPAWLLACNVQLLQANTAGLFSPVTPVLAQPEPATAAEAQADPLLLRLQQHMTESHAYRTEGLTLAALAQQVSVPQYRLRQLINRELGFRHFNAFLNHYRIAEACSRLRKAESVPTPIVTIALEVGFGSLSTFNKAFREACQETPSEYRRHHAGRD
ncbi:helix-turn-helix transcriptional regulator [Atopomonas sediminilitoris]|uniref:helix-turn-helix transcriptional regulator n=1 Tax=Atopomonas sediminilitoris TaxID=2919919 RepID=UPI001F4D5B05|nr:helix-turn-helix transcriptional regulator [Atopomonas sediminilitoris]MCJ8170221.1 helix-turn-helix transcriptional regulator [Atopomonas sediminilitoris]